MSNVLCRHVLCCAVSYQVNERYLPQLTSVLTFPQSVGIVGGRPGASLFFVGVQAGAVLYLDPHEVQEVCEGVVGWVGGWGFMQL